MPGVGQGAIDAFLVPRVPGAAPAPAIVSDAVVQGHLEELAEINANPPSPGLLAAAGEVVELAAGLSPQTTMSLMFLLQVLGHQASVSFLSLISDRCRHQWL